MKYMLTHADTSLDQQTRTAAVFWIKISAVTSTSHIQFGSWELFDLLNTFCVVHRLEAFDLSPFFCQPEYCSEPWSGWSSFGLPSEEGWSAQTCSFEASLEFLGSAQGEVHHVIYFSTSLDAIKRYSISEKQKIRRGILDHLRLQHVSAGTFTLSWYRVPSAGA